MISAAQSKTEVDVEQIIERMRSVRMSGHDHVVELQGEAKRLVDWKEYVRAKPLLSVAAASLVGFGVVRNSFFVVSKPSPSMLATGAPLVDNKSIRSTIGNSIAIMATSIVSNAVKTYIANMLQRGIAKGEINDRFQHEKPKD
ncbi:MAG: hypothetical protein K9M08_21380 [Pirellula sp.]|nr:hypothetical protein [Pirellula sp.]